jgi:hypothetical protein
MNRTEVSAVVIPSDMENKLPPSMISVASP